MKIRAFAVLGLLALTIPAPMVVRAQNGPSEPRFQVRVDTPDARADRAKLESEGYDILAVNPDTSTIDLAASRAQIEALEADGRRVVVIDRAHPLQEVFQSKASTGGLAVAAAVPATYQDLNGILARMQDIASSHPDIAKMVDITATYGTPPTAQGRHLFALKISDNVTVDEDEPAMLIVSAHHAREITTPLITLGAAERLTSGYGSDPRITSAVDANEIWIAPVWNPDGYNHVFTTDNMWRKNRRVFGGGVGVDQNRNYPQGWGASCSGSTNVSSETYKGPSAGSEAETQTMMTWSRQERFAKVIDYHSSGREVLYAYLCLSHPFTTWMRQEAIALSQVSGYGGATRLPSAEGEHPEWQFAQMGAYAFLIETHTEFQPSYDSGVTEATLVWPGVLSVLERPIPVSGHVSAASNGSPVAATIEILSVTFSNGETNASGGAHGRYHMFLPPGTYNIRFSAAGYTPATRQVTVTSTSSEVVDVMLLEQAPGAPQNLRIIR
jgi:hypothetical protein